MADQRFLALSGSLYRPLLYTTRIFRLQRPTVAFAPPQTRVRRRRPHCGALFRPAIASVSTRSTRAYALLATKRYITNKFADDVSADIDEDEAIEAAYGLENAVLNAEGVPSDERIMEILQMCESAALSLSRGDSIRSPPKIETPRPSNTPASALLNITSNSSRTLVEQIDAISSLAYNLVTAPNVFISPRILRSYVNIQCLLKRPSSLPEILELYARKPIPQQGTLPIRYKESNPHKASAAIDKDTANIALQAAIRAKDLGLALSVIETTYCTGAFRRNKIAREASVPLAGAVAAPFAIYALSSQLANFQDTMDPETATKMTFAAIAAYVVGTSTIGIVAITTRNDQMERVTWATGLALRERWIREPERAAVDRVAAAWGFKDVDRRGEEEGDDWELLKEWAGNRGMVVDKVELMEGME